MSYLSIELHALKRFVYNKIPRDSPAGNLFIRSLLDVYVTYAPCQYCKYRISIRIWYNVYASYIYNDKIFFHITFANLELDWVKKLLLFFKSKNNKLFN